jgi:hypothetical protein
MSAHESPNITEEVERISQSVERDATRAVENASEKFEALKTQVRDLGDERPKSKYLVSPQVDELIFWRNKVNSGVVLSVGIMLYLLVDVFDYTILSLTSWVAFALLCASLLFVFFSNLMTRFRNAPPLDENRRNWPGAYFRLHPKRITANLEGVIDQANLCITKLQDVFYSRDIVVTLKAAGVAAAAGYITSYFNLITILFLVFFFAFTAPITYITYQKEIDAAWAKFLVKTKETTKVVLEKFPRTPKKDAARKAD